MKWYRIEEVHPPALEWVVVIYEADEGLHEACLARYTHFLGSHLMGDYPHFGFERLVPGSGDEFTEQDFVRMWAELPEGVKR